MDEERETQLLEEINGLRKVCSALDKVAMLLNEMLKDREGKLRTVENLSIIWEFRCKIIRDKTVLNSCDLIDALILRFATTKEEKDEELHVYDTNFIIKQLQELKIDIRTTK